MNEYGELNKRSEYKKRHDALVRERSSWDSHWQEISEFLTPRSSRFLVTNSNKGDKRHNSIKDNNGSRALRVLSAGLMAGITSPARPWFRLATPDESLMEFTPVKQWLDLVGKIMRNIFAKSNTYRVLPMIYSQLGAYGTAANFVMPDYDNVIHHTPLSIGEYCIATDSKSNVNTLSREFQWTIGQIVQEFGINKVSHAVAEQFRKGNIDAWWPLVHIVEPRLDRDYGAPGNRNMPFKSCWFEKNTNEDKFLRESGMKRFRALVPRWDVDSGDIYGNSPGMEALGMLKGLQHDAMRKAQGIDYKVKPPIAVPPSLKEQPNATLPGGVAYLDLAAGQQIQSLFDVNIDLSHLLADIQDSRGQIQQTFYADLFLMLATIDQMVGRGGKDMTAREVAERHEEKLLMLGPVLERLHNELLKPLIDITFDEMITAGIVPPPPSEMQGVDLEVEFVSMLAQAQRAVGTQSIDRLIGMIGSVALMQANAGLPPTALDKLDADEAIDAYSDMLGVDPNLIVSDDNVVLIRKDRAAQMQAAQKAALAQQVAETAKTASEANTEGKNALTDTLGQFSGYSVPGTL
jgi:hypothetical protein